MMGKAAARIPLIFPLLVCCTSFGLGQRQLGRRRECCAYSLGEDSGGSVCSHKSGCILQQDDGMVVSSPGLDECRVLRDSKRYSNKSSSKAECLSEVFNVQKEGEKKVRKNLPWSVRPYVLETKGAKSLPAVSVVVDYTTLRWTGLRFRLLNTDVCQSPPDVAVHCNPRCVVVKRDESLMTLAASRSFVYDCEVGFYPSETQMTARTSGHTYRLDICTTDEEDFAGFCGSYLFTMPEANQIVQGQHLILVDTASLEKEQKLSLLFPEPLRTTERFVLMKTDDNSTLIETIQAEKGVGDLDVQLGGHLQVGVYQIVDDDRRVIARFELKHDDKKHFLQTTSLAVTLFLVTFTLLALVTYLRYVWVKKFNKVDPDNPNGIAGKHVVRKVLVMSSVENRQHVNIIFQLNEYLKTNCGIGTVYFALDPETGISCQADGDPWKWAQETTAIVSDDEGGHVLIVAPPPRNNNAGPAEIYEGLIDHQAFVSTKVLRELDAKKKVSVAMFSYSDESRLPSVIPDHIKERKLRLPDDMNKLVSDILQVEKRRLCSCLPIAFIRPVVNRCDLTKSLEGKQILRHVKQLKDNVKRFKEPSELHTGQENVETAPLNCKRLLIVDQVPNSHEDDDKKAKLSAEPAAFQVQIESNTLSLRSKVLANRDPSDVAQG